MQESDKQANNQQATLFDTGLVSGLFLGEGSVGFIKHSAEGLIRDRFSPRVRISNTDYALISAIDSILTNLSIPHYVEKANKTTGGKQSWNVLVLGWKRVRRFCEVFTPLTIGNKHEQLELLTELITIRLSVSQKEPYGVRELELYDRIKALNKQKVLRD